MKHTVHWSLACWIAKTVIAAINLIIFGTTHSRAHDVGFEFAEGFWCAVSPYLPTSQHTVLTTDISRWFQYAWQA